MMTNQQSSEQCSPERISRANRIALNGLIVLHLLAVALPPLAFQTGGQLGDNGIVATLYRPLQSYCQFLYLNRGYAFFAPDPGPSHLFQAELTTASGDSVEQMTPDRERHWPRLLYHRHFMLAEFLHEIYQPPGPPEDLAAVEPVAADEWLRLRARYEHVRQSITDHLRHTNDDREVRMRRIEHLIPGNLEFLESGIALNDPLLYEVLLDLPLDQGTVNQADEPAAGGSLGLSPETATTKPPAETAP